MAKPLEEKEHQDIGSGYHRIRGYTDRFQRLAIELDSNFAAETATDSHIERISTSVVEEEEVNKETMRWLKSMRRV